MEPFCTITATRNDRPQFLNFCKHQLARMTVQPKETFFVDHLPVSKENDLTLRIRLGIAMAEAAGIDVCYIIEDDDAYPKDYFETMAIENHDFIGSVKTIYYNIRNSTYKEFLHPNRSSLFCTGFRISALRHFSWPPDDALFLDLYLWKYAMKMDYKLLAEPVGVGIKHGNGAGVGHRIAMPNKDADWGFLKTKVDKEAFAFYRSL